MCIFEGKICIAENYRNRLCLFLHSYRRGVSVHSGHLIKSFKWNPKHIEPERLFVAFPFLRMIKGVEDVKSTFQSVFVESSC